MTRDQILTLIGEAAKYGHEFSDFGEDSRAERNANLCAALWSLTVMCGEIAYQLNRSNDRAEERPPATVHRMGHTIEVRSDGFVKCSCGWQGAPNSGKMTDSEQMAIDHMREETAHAVQQWESVFSRRRSK